MVKKIGIYRHWLEPAPPGVPKSEWPRKRRHGWIVRWYDSNGKRSGTLCKTKAEAERLRDRLAGEFDKSPANRKRPEKISLGEFVTEFLDMRTGPRGARMSIGAVREARTALKRFEAFMGSGKVLAHITPADAARFVAKLRGQEPVRRPGEKYSPATINKTKRTLKAAFSAAVKQLGYLKVNPFDGIRADRVAETPTRYVSVAEFTALLEAARNLDIESKQLWWQVFITVAYTAGLRSSEIANLLWTDVDFEHDSLRVIAKPEVGGLHGWQPKDADARTVSIPTITIDLLARLQAQADAGNPYILIPTDRLRYIRAAKAAGTWKEGQPVLNNLQREWDRLTTLAGITDATIHDLRRSAITNWARCLPIHTVMELAGHANVSTTQRYYLAVTSEDLERARQATEEALRTETEAD